MQSGSPMELYKEPANMFVASFLGAPSMNFLNVEVQEIIDESAIVCNPILNPIKVPYKGRDMIKKSQAKLGLRPQYLRLVEPSDGMLKGTVILSERLGAETIIEILDYILIQRKYTYSPVRKKKYYLIIYYKCCECLDSA